MISIIMCAYNAEKTIGFAIQSILASTYKNIELLVIDDGSTDKTWEIVNQYSKIDHRIKLFYKENTGIANSRNFGLDRVSGDWVTFADADDSINQNIYKKCHEIIETFSPDLIVYDYIRVINGNKLQKNTKINVEENILLDRYYIDNCIIPAILHTDKTKEKYSLGFSVWNKIYKKSIVNDYNIRFKDERRTFEDGIFNAEYQRQMKSCFYIPEVGYNYTVTEGSITHSLHDDMLDILIDNYKCYSQIYAEYIVNEHEGGQFRNYFCETILNYVGEGVFLFRRTDEERLKTMFHRLIANKDTQTLFSTYKSKFISRKLLIMALKQCNVDSFYKYALIDYQVQKWIRRSKKILKKVHK